MAYRRKHGRGEPTAYSKQGGALAVVDVFDLDRTLVADYASFARSFTQIRAQDIRDKVDEIYANRRFWPEPLITAFRAGFIRRNAGSKWVAPS